MVLIIFELIIFGWVVAAYTWYKLETFEKREKITYIIIGFIVCYMITLLLCNIASIGIEFEAKEIKKEILKNLILVFTPINSIILMPYIGKTISDYDSNVIEKEEVLKKIRNILIIFVVVAIIEVILLRNTQIGTLQYMENLKNNK